MISTARSNDKNAFKNKLLACKKAAYFQKQSGSKPLINSKAGENDISMMDVSKEDYDNLRGLATGRKNKLVKVDEIENGKLNGQVVDQKNYRNTLQQSRNTIIDQRYSDINTTQKIIYTCNNNSQCNDEPIFYMQPLKSLDNNQLHSPKQQLIQLFSPSKLLTTNKPTQKNLENFNDFQNVFYKTPQNDQIEQVAADDKPSAQLKSQLQKGQWNYIDCTLDEKQTQKISKILDFDEDQTIEQSSAKNIKLNENVKYEETDRNQDGPCLKDGKIRDKSKMQYSSVVLVSEIQTQGDIMKPHSILNLKKSGALSQNDTPQRRPLSRKDKSSQLKLKLIHEDSDSSSIFNENVVVSDGYDQRQQAKQFLQQIYDYETNVKSDRIQSDRLHAIKSIDSQCDLVTLQNLQPNLQKADVILELNLRLVNLKEIQPSMFTSNKFLKFIDLRNNRLKEIPDSICELQNLWKLRVDYNYLVSLPENIGSLTKLEYLSASQNKIASLPDKLFDLKYLSVLILNDNKIKDLNIKIGNLTTLNVMMLHNNQIIELPFQMGQMKQLAELSLDWLVYQDPVKNQNRHLKGEGARSVISDFLIFLNALQKTAQLANLMIEKAHFIHFLMYFHKLSQVQDIQNITFNTKKRGIFHLMALNGQMYLLQELLENFNMIHMDINKVDQEQSTPFILAIRNKRKDFVKYLLTVPLTNINRTSFKYGHPMHLAIKSHEFKLALQLLNGSFTSHHRHLDVNSISEDGNNSMHYLFSNFYINPEISSEIGQQLIRKRININLKNKNGYSPLQIAVIGGQNIAIQFALDFNKTQRQQGNELEIFNFNLKGGKLNQNSLYLAIQQNNVKVISTLLNSDEIMDFLSVDDEGRLPKDICPYNSPIYKLLCQYELKVHRQIYDQVQSQNNCTNMINGLQPNKQEIVQYYYNKRNYESPQKIRMKILEKAKIADETTKKRKNIRGRSQVSTAKNQNNFNQHKSIFEDSKLNHNRLLSQNQKAQTQMFKLIDEMVSSAEDDKSNFDPQSPMTRQLSGNFNITSTLERHNQKPSITPLLQKELSIDLLINSEKINFKSHNIKSRRKRRDSLTSDDIQISKKKDINRDSFDKSYRQYEFELPKAFQVRDNFQNRVFASKEKAEAIADKKQSVMRERFDDDDANVPEEEHDDEAELQKPQMKLFTKCPSQKAIFSCESFSNPELMKLARNILDQVSQSKTKKIYLNSFQVQQQNQPAGYLTIPTQELIQSLCQSQIINQQIILPDYNMQLSDASYIYNVNDDSKGIQAPQDPQKNLKVSVSLLKKTGHKFNEIKKDSYKNEFQIYQEFYTLISRDKIKDCFELLISQLDNGKITSRYQIDLVYIIGSKLNIKQIQQMMYGQSQSNLVDKKINQRIYEYYLFELINLNEINTYDNKNRKSLMLKQTSLQQLDYSQPQLQHSFHLSQIIAGPFQKMSLSKSPSVVINEKDNKQQEVFNNQYYLSNTNNYGSVTQSLSKGLSPKPPIYDIKQMIESRKSLDTNNNQKVSISSKGLIQVKKPLIEREDEYKQTILQQSMNQQKSQNSTQISISKKDSLQQFQQNYHAIFKNNNLTQTSKIQKINQQRSISNQMSSTSGSKIAIIQKNSNYLQTLKNKNIVKIVPTKIKQTLLSSSKNQKKLELPGSQKSVLRLDQKLKILDAQNQTQKNPSYLKLANSAPSKPRKMVSNNKQSRNSSNQMFQTDESIGKKDCQRQKDQDIMNDQKFQLSDPIKQRENMNPAQRISKLKIQVFNNEEIESFHDQLRIKDKWDVIKESHTQKMDKVHETAIRRKHMFSSHHIPHEQKLEKRNQSLENNKQNSIQRVSNIEQKYQNLFRNSDLLKAKSPKIEIINSQNHTTKNKIANQNKLHVYNNQHAIKGKSSNIIQGIDL